jgi:hypothetical protein
LPFEHKSGVSSHPLVICVGENKTTTGWFINELFGILHAPSAHEGTLQTRKKWHVGGVEVGHREGTSVKRYMKLYNTLVGLNAFERSRFNFQQFDEIGALSLTNENPETLTPMRRLLPWVLQAFPNARVVLLTDVDWLNGASMTLESKIARAANNMVVRCITAPRQLLEINVRDTGKDKAKEGLHRFVADLLPC